MTSLGWFRSGLACAATSAAFLFVTSKFGSIVRSDSSGVSTYLFSPLTRAMTTASLILICAATGVLAWKCQGWTRLFAMPFALIASLVGVSTRLAFCDAVVIGKSEVAIPGVGFPFHPVEHIRFDRIDSVEVVRRQDSGAGRDAPAEELLLAMLQPRSKVRMPLGDLLRAAMPELRSTLRSRGILVLDIDESVQN